MQLMCIDKGSYFFTVGKIYEGKISKASIFEYYVTNDKGFQHGVEYGLFVDISIIREEKLKQLDI